MVSLWMVEPNEFVYVRRKSFLSIVGLLLMIQSTVLGVFVEWRQVTLA